MRRDEDFGGTIGNALSGQEAYDPIEQGGTIVADNSSLNTIEGESITTPFQVVGCEQKRWAHNGEAAIPAFF